ncbi:hypothetical protein KY285_028295 [Solanum tuberosum]|nr:hypothetical protein KY285_028295 [Solanum tuberosum]
MLGQTPQHPNKAKLREQINRVLRNAKRLTTDSGVLSWINDVLDADPGPWNDLSNATEFAQFRVRMNELCPLEVGQLAGKSVRKFVRSESEGLRVKRKRRGEGEDQTSFRQRSSGVIPTSLWLCWLMFVVVLLKFLVGLVLVPGWNYELNLVYIEGF